MFVLAPARIASDRWRSLIFIAAAFVVGIGFPVNDNTRLSSLVIQMTSLSLRPSHREVEYYYDSRVAGSLPSNECSSQIYPSCSENESSAFATPGADSVQSEIVPPSAS